MHLSSASADETRLFGKQLGAQLRGGDVIALEGELGAGKTTLIQGILQGMGSRDRVTSPTFTLVNLYRAGRLEVQHVDAYRLGGAAATLEAESLGLEETLGASDVVTLIEWAGIVPTLLARANLVVALDHAGEHVRTLDLSPRDARGSEIVTALRQESS